MAPNSPKSPSATHPLVQRSNYDCIKGGHTREHGLNYKADLTAAANLPRTAHKLAEKRRRDRFIIALQAMEKLLPPGAGRSRKNQHICKATVLEAAIKYIQVLQQENASQTSRPSEEPSRGPENAMSPQIAGMGTQQQLPNVTEV